MMMTMMMILSQDVEKVLRDAEINKLKTQADYVSIVEQSFLSKYQEASPSLSNIYILLFAGS